MIKVQEDVYTVVVFSSKIKDSSLPKESKQPEFKLYMKYIDWPFGDKYRNQNGKHIVSTIYNTYKIKLKMTKSLRIVCIDALDSKGELSEETAKDILHYLKRNIEQTLKKGSSAVDAIILPKFKPMQSESGDVIELLWYLRKHAVLITNSSLHVTLPGTEVIAVAAETAQQSRPASVIDFVVTGSKNEWLSFDLAKSLGPAAAAALALSILHILRESDGDLLKGIILCIVAIFTLCMALTYLGHPICTMTLIDLSDFET